MIEYFQSNLWQLWALVSLLCLILELTSGDFFIMCFSLGAIPALIASLFDTSFTAQIIIFAVCSALCIFFVRPIALKYLHKHDERLSNAEALIGREGRVTQTIEAGDYGRVAVDGDDWKARSATGERIAKETRVRIVKLDSIIVTVEPLD
ncbi:MAG: NfeD family protein [Muribaculaceae bacterium]|nr:NfeD family protein [Muribaculaceae bacterium]